jgi:hypothetical protein
MQQNHKYPMPAYSFAPTTFLRRSELIASAVMSHCMLQHINGSFAAWLTHVIMCHHVGLRGRPRSTAQSGQASTAVKKEQTISRRTDLDLIQQRPVTNT